MTKKNLQFTIYNLQSGQTLVLLLVFVTVAIAITAAAIFILTTNSISATNFSQGRSTKAMAEAGVEKALLSLLRDPNYKGETFSLDTGTVTATVSGTTTLTISVAATDGDYVKRVEVIATYSNNVLIPTSWKDLN
jgi:hypothetical protein